jgi:chromosome partitioning protein
VTVTIAVVSGKGGTGKTTTTINLACALAERDHRVLAVDMDPQANLTSGLGLNPYRLEATVLPLLIDDSADRAPAPVTRYGVDLLPCNPDLASVEAALESRIGRELRLRNALGRMAKYDFVFIDTPPNFGFHTLNAMAAADYILVPVQMSGFALRGLVEVQRTVASMREELNPKLRLIGVLPTFVSPRTNLSHDILAGLRALPDLWVFKAQVKSTVKFAETSLDGVPILRYASSSNAANAYRVLAVELKERIEMLLREESALAAEAALTGPLISEPIAGRQPEVSPSQVAAAAEPEALVAAAAPIVLSTTGALSVDALALLGTAPGTAAAAGPEGAGAKRRPLTRISRFRSDRPAARVFTHLFTLARRLAS